MEGVAARLGRSSTRYGPAAVFSGPVRRWNKKWVPLSNPDHCRRSGSGGGGGLLQSSSHLLLYRWTPASSPADGAAVLAKNASAATPQLEEPPRRKFRYVPIFVIEERKEESSPKSSGNTSPNEGDQFSRMGHLDSSGTNTNMNIISTEEVQASYKDQTSSEEGNGADLDLSLGLRAPEGEPEVEPKTSKQGEGHVKLARASSTHDTEKKNPTKSASQHRLKRKAAATAGFEMGM